MAQVTATATQIRLDSLTGLRFYAALVVLARHIVPATAPITGLSQLAAIGPIGVGFFFVLSGFVLAWTWEPGTPARHFYVKRFARVYPLHLATTLIAICILASEERPHWFSSVISIPLLQGWGPDTWRVGGNTPSWSLSAELFFYVCFPFVIPTIRRLTTSALIKVAVATAVLMGLWTVAYGVAALTDVPNVTIVSTYTNPLYRFGEFVIGLSIARMMQNGWRPRVSIRSSLIVAVFAYAALAGLNEYVVGAGVNIGDTPGLPLGVLDLLYLPITCLLIAAAAGSDLAARPSPVGGRLAVKLGQWSFALYLTQLVIFALLEPHLPTGTSLANVGLLVLIVLVCIAVSALTFEYFERPVEAVLRRRIGASRSAV